MCVCVGGGGGEGKLVSECFCVGMDIRLFHKALLLLLLISAEQTVNYLLRTCNTDAFSQKKDIH